MAVKKQISPVIAVIVIVVVLAIVGVIYSLTMGRKTATTKPLGGQEGMAKMKQMIQQKMQQGKAGGG